MADCTDLNGLRSDTSPTENADSNRDEYLSQLIDAYYLCHPSELDELANSPSSEIGTKIRKTIGIDDETEGQLQLEEDINRLVSQINESKRPINPNKPKDLKSHKEADPVMMYNGQFVHEVTDIHINGAGIDFVFNRSYRNQVIFRRNVID